MMKRVASLRYGVIFKKAFCDVEVFTAFVKDIIGIELEITKVETEKSFQPPVGKVATKFDLFAEDKKNRIIVDIQHVRDDDHYDRFLHYHCVALLEQAESAHYYKPEMHVFTIVVLTSRDKHGAAVAITDFAPRTLEGNRLPELEHKMIFLNPKHVSETTPEPYRQWLCAIDDSLDEVVDETQYSTPPLQRMFQLIEQDDVSPEDRARMFDEHNLDKFVKKTHEEGWVEGWTRGWDDGQQKGLMEGREEGREKGQKEGFLKAKQQIAKTMLQEGIDRATVLKLTGLRSEDLDHD